ncbi:hypothetical protein MUG84_07900 [Paenibacillus sp. KQZ6P-2]|uniref:Uncharacterized protein n=1 Tax=Paenibacillus mangrovi TaxID=2931978 RepID=A0A9X1WTS4_9BACL|nr:hypothetical protein [Paenibacillus mangrovi]MCJ8011674.1 hypothetical protein [Paenibacillus mangrovi]
MITYEQNGQNDDEIKYGRNAPCDRERIPHASRVLAARIRMRALTGKLISECGQTPPAGPVTGYYEEIAPG